MRCLTNFRGGRGHLRSIFTGLNVAKANRNAGFYIAFCIIGGTF